MGKSMPEISRPLLTLRLDEKIALRYHGLGKLLHCVEVFCAIPANQIHFAERTPANDLDKLEVVQTDLLVWSEQVFTSFAAILIILSTRTILHIIDGLGHDLWVVLVLVRDETLFISTVSSRFYTPTNMNIRLKSLFGRSKLKSTYNLSSIVLWRRHNSPF